jgi:hypothetical protein
MPCTTWQNITPEATMNLATVIIHPGKKRNGEKELAHIAYVIASSISLLYSFIH